MSAANLESLSALHKTLADTMANALDSEIARMQVSRELLELDLSTLDEASAKVISNILTLAPTARVDNALLKTIAGFLKDNGITADLDTGEDLDATAEKLAKMQEKRSRVSLPTDTLQ